MSSLSTIILLFSSSFLPRFTNFFSSSFAHASVTFSFVSYVTYLYFSYYLCFFNNFPLPLSFSFICFLASPVSSLLSFDFLLSFRLFSYSLFRFSSFLLVIGILPIFPSSITQLFFSYVLQVFSLSLVLSPLFLSCRQFSHPSFSSPTTFYPFSFPLLTSHHLPCSSFLLFSSS